MSNQTTLEGNSPIDKLGLIHVGPTLFRNLFDLRIHPPHSWGLAPLEQRSMGGSFDSQDQPEIRSIFYFLKSPGKEKNLSPVLKSIPSKTNMGKWRKKNIISANAISFNPRDNNQIMSGGPDMTQSSAASIASEFKSSSTGVCINWACRLK